MLGSKAGCPYFSPELATLWFDNPISFAALICFRACINCRRHRADRAGASVGVADAADCIPRKLRTHLSASAAFSSGWSNKQDF
jgi:hypothetical protein